jgi:hypothetical protein
VPTDADWLHEVKFDGYRAQAHKVSSRVCGRNGYDFTERFPSIAQLLHELSAKAACSMARSSLAMPMVVQTSPGCTCVGPGRALSTPGRSIYLRATAAIFVRICPLEARGMPAGSLGALRLPGRFAFGTL